MSVTHLKGLKIPIPPTEEQKQIVEKIDLLDNNIKSVMSAYKREIDNLNELKKSILEKAFKGELTSAA